ncbi:MAG: Fic family protein [Candidatus Limnocylindrales bacterium]
MGAGPRIAANLQRVAVSIVSEAGARRPPKVAMAQDWHREIHAGVVLPVPYFAGEARDTDQRFPELSGYEVRIGSATGVPSALVPSELASFEAGAGAVVASIDALVPVGARPGSMAELTGILQAAALIHGDWVRIHPFANANGRVARLWANWIAARYELPFFVTLRPRPAGIGYAAAAAASMRGDHGPMAIVFHAMLRAELARRP